MKRFIDRIRDIRDDYIDNLLYAFMKMLKEHDKLEAITFKLDDQYWKALNKNKVFRPEREDEDVLVDSY